MPDARQLTATIQPWLDRVNAELLEDLRPGEADLRPLVDHVAGYRGKQLRPALVLLTAEACGHVQPAHVTVAKVIELIHTATLVHDDILDDASMRRRLPTVNSMHGNEVPVLLGDYLYALAFELAVAMDDPTCSRVLAAVVREVCQGEITQILHRFDFEWTEERYFQVIRDKTASLYGAAGRLGAHYAGADDASQHAFEDYGIELGVAFQIVDDCLDLVGDERVVGKSLGTDLIKGKLTLPLLRLLQGAGERREHLVGLVGQADALPRLRAEFDVAGAVKDSLSIARDRVRRAVAGLTAVAEHSDRARSPGAEQARAALGALADYVVRRDL